MTPGAGTRACHCAADALLLSPTFSFVQLEGKKGVPSRWCLFAATGKVPCRIERFC